MKLFELMSKLDKSKCDRYNKELEMRKYRGVFYKESLDTLNNQGYDNEEKKQLCNIIGKAYDYWNIKTECSTMDDDKGVSAVIVVTEKGRAAFKNLQDEIVCVRTRAKNFFKTNRNILLPSPKHPRRECFFRDLADNRADVIELTRQNLEWTKVGEFLWKLRRHFEKRFMMRMAESLEEGDSI